MSDTEVEKAEAIGRVNMVLPRISVASVRRLAELLEIQVYGCCLRLVHADRENVETAEPVRVG